MIINLILKYKNMNASYFIKNIKYISISIYIYIYILNQSVDNRIDFHNTD